jgi:glycosyltransferase involved in cell wall biosynthesis
MRVGFVYPHAQESWLGGINYLRNLFTALESAPDLGVQPVLLAGMGSSVLPALSGVEMIRSRWLDLHAWLGLHGIWNFMGFAPILDRLLAAHQVQLLSHSGFLGLRPKVRALAWIPDLQHRHLPALFSKAELAVRDRLFEDTLRLSQAVVLSSVATRDDVERFYPGHGKKLRVLRFVDCSSPAVGASSRADLEARYDFNGPYFVLPNQYWVHKNHGVVLESLDLLKRQGRRVVVLSTGSTSDYRNELYFGGLMRRRAELGLEAEYRVLGLVPYQDLAGLLRHAVAVVNPSRFEGWSTTVEEAKSLGKQIILSDLPVHREQGPERGRFFDPDDAKQLAGELWEAWNGWNAGEDAAAADRAAGALPGRRRAFAREYAAIAREVVGE